VTLQHKSLVMRSLIIKLLTSFFARLERKKKYQSLFGFLYNVSLRGMNLRDHRPGHNGEDQLKEALIRYFKAKGNEPVIFLDVGANMGGYAKHLMRLSKSADLTFNLHAFEPMKKTFEILTEQFDQVDYEKGNVNLYNFGLGERNEQLPMFADHKASPLASLYLRDMDNLSFHFENVGHVHVRNFAEVWEELDIAHVNFMKVDTEGHEVSILKSIKTKLDSKKVDFIQFEFGTTIESRIFLKDFFDLLHPNYRIFRILKDGLYEYPVYHPDYEIFVLGNYLAVSRSVKDFTWSK
ncbi:MAG: FkbM family methyltransferase, partial [Bacteroidota bacterium]